ncbi:hypothetical protein QBC36DRAFT_326625 [Triangularia setosa]|uniref:Uncharacterized protein n=1 Tax=Triangularia setosa TaxID=2587417 RepID=A0AAN6W9T5_9PEZI|nr:hypothetical protein QBC36DRAFT_326625 [Podospora setosa]
MNRLHPSVSRIIFIPAVPLHPFILLACVPHCVLEVLERFHLAPHQARHERLWDPRPDTKVEVWPVRAPEEGRVLLAGEFGVEDGFIVGIVGGFDSGGDGGGEEGGCQKTPPVEGDHCCVAIDRSCFV